MEKILDNIHIVEIFLILHRISRLHKDVDKIHFIYNIFLSFYMTQIHYDSALRTI